MRFILDSILIIIIIIIFSILVLKRNKICDCVTITKPALKYKAVFNC